MNLPNVRDPLAEEMFEYLNEHLPVEVKKKIDTPVVRELLDCLAEWAYLQRRKESLLVGERVRKRIEGEAPISHGDLNVKIREMLKPDTGEKSSRFLDALEDIS